jgi:cytochrome o ubiquinol oxidase subunit 2
MLIPVLRSMVILRSLLLLVLLGSLGGCGTAVLSPVGPVGAAERTILLDSVAIMLAIVVPTIVATLAFAWWFRAGNRRARYQPTWAYSGKLELLMWSVPALVILFLGGIAWIGSHELDPAKPLKPSPLQIEVVSLDWKWLFIYPGQQVASINRVVVPAGVPLHFRVTSASVMNVFFVPRLGSEIYSMSGMATQLNLQADEPGLYPGLSANFSGDGFSDMRFDLQAVPARQFDEWVAASRHNGGVLDDAAYRGLLRQSSGIQAYTYGSVQPGLFERIVTLQLPPGEGPRSGRPRPDIKPTAGY